MLDLSEIEKTKDENDRIFLKEAYDFAWRKSEDKKTRTGTLIVKDGEIISHGVNVLPRAGRKSSDWLNRAMKWKHTAHSERMAIQSAEKREQSIKGSTVYTTCLPCQSCAIMIIDSGAKTLVSHLSYAEKTPDVWADEAFMALEMMKKSGIKILLYDGEIGELTKAIFNGEEWKP